MALIIGLTGGIACGKTTVSKVLREFNIPVVDADKIAREVVQVGQPVYKEIVAYFGEGILQENKEVDRQKLGKIIFANKEKRLILNNLTHPTIRKCIEKSKDEYIKEGHKVIVLDIPLLLESTDYFNVDKILVVYANKATQLARLMKRNHLSESEAMARVSAQMSVEEMLQFASGVIDNSGSLAETKEQLRKILEEWVAKPIPPSRKIK